jgi:uncharacterized protein
MKFLADRMLGRLARYLRMLGHDAAYVKEGAPLSLLRRAREEERILLTRDRRLVSTGGKAESVLVGGNAPFLQLKELLDRKIVRLEEGTAFSRCLSCNLRLEAMPREEAEGQVPDYIFFHHDAFLRCSGCGRIYWKGSHLERMRHQLETLLRNE